MNPEPKEARLPASIGGLIDLASAALIERAGLYALLGLAVFAICGLIEALWHTASAGDVELKGTVLEYVELFGLSYIVATVTLAVGTRAAGERPAVRALLEAALVRYLPVLGTMIVTQFVLDMTLPLAGIGPLPDQPAILFFTAPLTWFIWGVLSLAPPYAALSIERPGMAILSAFGHAIGAAMHPRNFVRLCLVSFVTVAPALLFNVLDDIFTHRGVRGGDFWAAVPIDVITVAPLTALQTVFALDFARRAAAQRDR